jgi:hypothetical protein
MARTRVPELIAEALRPPTAPTEQVDATDPDPASTAAVESAS